MFGLAPCLCRKHVDRRELCGCHDRRLVMSSWGLGAVDRIGTVTYDSCRYTADYIGKALTGVRSAEYGAREAPFAAISQGVGRDYCDAHADELRARKGLTIHGVHVGLPRYFARRLGIEAVPGEEFDQAEWKRRGKWYQADLNLYDPSDERMAVAAARRARAALFSREPGRRSHPGNELEGA